MKVMVEMGEDEAREFFKWRHERQERQAANGAALASDLGADLTVRTANLLRSAGIYTQAELLEKSHADLKMIPNLGRKSLVEIDEFLSARGLRLR